MECQGCVRYWVLGFRMLLNVILVPNVLQCKQGRGLAFRSIAIPISQRLLMLTLQDTVLFQRQ